MNHRITITCPADPAELATWLVNSAATHRGQAVTVDFTPARDWLRSASDIVDVINRLGMEVVSAYGIPDTLRVDVRILVEAEILRPWCVLPAEEVLVVREKVRAGQVVRHGGDVEVLGDVAPGGQVVAGGSVRIAGTLAGKVMAGGSSDLALVLCGRLEAEMVAIGRHYVVGDKIDARALGKPYLMRLQGVAIALEPMVAAAA